jgi:glycosyltransferase involved in cell wall biosynthesis
MKDLKISILMPFYNAYPYLEESIKSVINQTYPNWELILINDFSSNLDLQTAKRFTNIDSRIKLFDNNYKGIIEALSLGLKKSTGFYISRFDADDIMPANRLEAMLKLASEHPNCLITGLSKYFSSLNYTISNGYKNYEKWLNNVIKQKRFYTDIYRECTIASPNWLIKKPLLEEIGGFSNLKYPEDYDLVFKLYENKICIKAVNEITLLWREHNLRTSRTHKNYSQQSFFDLKLNYFLKLDFDPSKRLLLLGSKNKKLAFTKSFFERLNVNFEIVFKENIEKTVFENSQVLSLVYPNKNERDKLLKLLLKNSVKESVNFWWL